MTWGLYKVVTSDGDVFFQSAYFMKDTFYTWIYFLGSELITCEIQVKSNFGERFIYHGCPAHLLFYRNKNNIIKEDLALKIGCFAARRSLDDNGNLNVETIIFKKVEDKSVEPSSNINSTTACEKQIVIDPAASSTTSSDTSPAPSTSR